jgi:hypothetical protein
VEELQTVQYLKTFCGDYYRMAALALIMEQRAGDLGFSDLRSSDESSFPS